jgi:hypothetical protein
LRFFASAQGGGKLIGGRTGRRQQRTTPLTKNGIYRVGMATLLANDFVHHLPP